MVVVSEINTTSLQTILRYLYLTQLPLRRINIFVIAPVGPCTCKAGSVYYLVGGYICCLPIGLFNLFSSYPEHTLRIVVIIRVFVVKAMIWFSG